MMCSLQGFFALYVWFYGSNGKSIVQLLLAQAARVFIVQPWWRSIAGRGGMETTATKRLEKKKHSQSPIWRLFPPPSLQILPRVCVNEWVSRSGHQGILLKARRTFSVWAAEGICLYFLSFYLSLILFRLFLPFSIPGVATVTHTPTSQRKRINTVYIHKEEGQCIITSDILCLETNNSNLLTGYQMRAEAASQP